MDHAGGVRQRWDYSAPRALCGSVLVCCEFAEEACGVRVVKMRSDWFDLIVLAFANARGIEFLTASGMLESSYRAGARRSSVP